MVYEITLHPKNKEAAEILRKEYQTLDDKFNELHSVRLHESKELDHHGLTLYGKGEKTFVHVYAEWDSKHMKGTIKDLKKAVQLVLGSQELYEIGMSG
jgi:hypothetical protein